MEDINGKKFPTVWSELFMNFAEVVDMNSEPTISMKCVTDWLKEYHEMKENYTLDLADDLYKRGCEVQSYFVSVKWRIHNMNRKWYSDYRRWKSQTMTAYTSGGPKDLAEAARERLIYGEEQYHQYKADLANLETMEGWAESISWALKDCLQQLDKRMAKLLADTPRSLHIN